MGIELRSIIPKPLCFQCLTNSKQDPTRTSRGPQGQELALAASPESAILSVWRAASMARPSRVVPLYLTGIFSRPSEMSFAGNSSRPLIHMFCTRGFMRGERFSIETQGRIWTRRASQIYKW